MTAQQLQRAACATLPIEMIDRLFFPNRGESAAPARQICAGCPIRVACAEEAFATSELFGVRGGLTERDRRAIRRERRACA